MASSKENKNSSQKIDSSSIIDMEVMEEDDSDYETNITESTTIGDAGRKRTRGEEPIMEDVQKKVTQNVASYVWQSGSQQAQKAFNTYANIDLLRPYFNIEPHEVRLRLLQSLIPRKTGSMQQKVPRELYGPTMLIFTLIALLLFQMKTGGHSVEEGTLMGSAFGTCFGYWFGVSGLVWVLTYVCNTHITMLQILSLLGYALFGHCIVLGLTTIFHTTHDHMFFYLMWAVFGGLSTLKMVSVILTRTTGRTQKIIVCSAIAVLHLCFLLYLHFAYHKMVEDLSELIDQGPVPKPGRNLPVTNELTKKMVERSVNTNVLNQGLPKVLPPGASEIIRQKAKDAGLQGRPVEGANVMAPPVIEAGRPGLPPGGGRVVAPANKGRAALPTLKANVKLTNGPLLLNPPLINPKGPLMKALKNQTKTA